MDFEKIHLNWIESITLWKRILPRSGFGNVSPEMTSSNNMSLSPLRKSSSMLSMAVPAFLKWLLHQAVNVYPKKKQNRNKLISLNAKYEKYFFFGLSWSNSVNKMNSFPMHNASFKQFDPKKTNFICAFCVQFTVVTFTSDVMSQNNQIKSWETIRLNCQFWFFNQKMERNPS